MPTSSTYYCYQVTDSANTPVSTRLGDRPRRCNVTLAAQSLTPSSPTIDVEQSLTIAISWSGGSSTYTATLYSGSSLSCASDTTVVDTAPDLSEDIDDVLRLSHVNQRDYCATVTDSAATPATMSSPADLVTVNPVLSEAAISPSSPSIDSAQSITLTASPSRRYHPLRLPVVPPPLTA